MVHARPFCQLLDHPSHLMKNLVGRRFGKLTVDAILGANHFGNAVWKCRCDCGGVWKGDAGRLTSGITTSCGCKKRRKQDQIATGQKYGFLVTMGLVRG